MKEVDASAQIDSGISQDVLMENAGHAAVEVILERFPSAGRDTDVLVFAGKGNNAGDAFVVARRLHCLERRVRIFMLGPPSSLTGSARKNHDLLFKMKAKIIQIENTAELEAFVSSASGPFTVVDGLLGTGLKGDLDGIYYDAVSIINRLDAREVISLDIPSGVSGDTGLVHGTSVLATLTVTFGFPKLGHFLPPGAARRGELVCADISLPSRYRFEGDKFLLTKTQMSTLVKERDRYGHKNSFGHTLLVGGSPGHLGAVAMAAGACHRMGTGLVTVATWDDCFEALQAKISDQTMILPPRDNNGISVTPESISPFSCVVAGPGLGTRPGAEKLIKDMLMEYRGPVVLDADALNLVSRHQMHEMLRGRPYPKILTPHPGEMARLLGCSKDEVKLDPVGAVRRAVELTHCVVVLKGAATLISSTEEKIFLNHYPNDGMATAGSGDVLSGIIGGLVGQGMDAFDAARLGVFLHSLAGDLAARQHGHRGMTAPDMIGNIGNAFNELKKAAHPAQQALEIRTNIL